MMNQPDIGDMLKRGVKYLVQGLAVAIAARYLPTSKIQVQEILMIAFTSAVVFAILDTWAPTIGAAARQGAGLTIGSRLAGGVPLRSDVQRM